MNFKQCNLWKNPRHFINCFQLQDPAEYTPVQSIDLSPSLGPHTGLLGPQEGPVSLLKTSSTGPVQSQRLVEVLLVDERDIGATEDPGREVTSEELREDVNKEFSEDLSGQLNFWPKRCNFCYVLGVSLHVSL